MKTTHLKPTPSFYEGEPEAQAQLVALPDRNQNPHVLGPLLGCPFILQQAVHSPGAGKSRGNCRWDWSLLTAGSGVGPCCKLQGGLGAPEMVLQSHRLEPSWLHRCGPGKVGATGRCSPLSQRLLFPPGPHSPAHPSDLPCTSLGVPDGRVRGPVLPSVNAEAGRQRSSGPPSSDSCRLTNRPLSTRSWGFLESSTHS